MKPVSNRSGRRACGIRDCQRHISDPGRFVEQITDESWNDHLRRFDRVTAADVALRERKLAFHIGEAPPVVTRCVVEG